MARASSAFPEVLHRRLEALTCGRDGIDRGADANAHRVERLEVVACVELHRGVVQVKISNFAFWPARIVVSPGTKVVWTNEDSNPHTVTTDQPGFSSQALDTGSRFTEVVNRPGTVMYHCTIHPFMHGAVVVQG